MNIEAPVIVDEITSTLKTFPNTDKITIGRNINCSVDIPDTCISRNQAVIKLTDGNKWVIKDLSSHKTTLVNKKKISEHVLENGDNITFFLYSGASFLFFYSIEHVPATYKKRKSDESETSSLLSPPKKVIKTDDANIAHEIATPFPEERKPKLAELDKLLNELQKYRQLYLTTINELTGVKKEKDVAINELSNVTKDLNGLRNLTSENAEKIEILQKEKEILKEKLKREEEANEKMVLEIQELNECLKESEQEQLRLAEEAQQIKDHSEKQIKEDREAVKSETESNSLTEKESNSLTETKESNSPIETKESNSVAGKEKEEDYFNALALQKIVDLVEVKWNEAQMEDLKMELKKKDDKITDLALETEKYKQDIAEIIDRELLCSICSEVLCNAITLNCRHTFCKECVVEWKNKKRECPVCRAKIKSEVHPLVIDSFLDRLFDIVGGDLKNRRDEVKAERSKSVMNAPSTSKGNDRNGRRPPRTPARHPRRTRANFPTITSAMSILQPQLVIDLRDIGSDVMAPSRSTFIDLTGSPQTRRGRGRSINYYNI